MSLLSRKTRRRYLRLKPLLLTLLFILLIDTIHILSTRAAPIRHSTLPSHLKDQKIFIVSIHRNSEYMLRLYWNSQILNLVKTLGPQNVFVSIVESGSQEDTKGALAELGGQLFALGAEHKIELGIDVFEQAKELQNVPEEGNRTGWIHTGRGKEGWEVRRIPYLANLRNQAMEPLLEMREKRTFDRILWINDVVFSTEDVTTLLSTRDGSYAAACALDFSSNPRSYYDTFALRDIDGQKTASQQYPYFFSSANRWALHHNLPIPVQSCWNGIISMDSKPFYATPPLRFRGVSDSLAEEHVEGSECCLIHADNPLRAQKGVWLNPNVRVAYNATTYSKINGGVEIKADYAEPAIVDGVPGGDGSVWPGGWEIITGVWVNRRARWLELPKLWSENGVMKRRVKAWAKKGRTLEVPKERSELGTECLINEMQVLYQNGWQHV